MRLPKKGNRIVAKRILYLFEENPTSKRFIDTVRSLYDHKWFHTGKSISENYSFLISEGKIVHIGNQYALVQEREDGSKFCVIKDPVLETVEL